jgi:hypothetical protein
MFYRGEALPVNGVSAGAMSGELQALQNKLRSWVKHFPARRFIRVILNMAKASFHARQST